MLYLQSFLRKGVSLGYVGRVRTQRTLKTSDGLAWLVLRVSATSAPEYV